MRNRGFIKQKSKKIPKPITPNKYAGKGLPTTTLIEKRNGRAKVFSWSDNDELIFGSEGEAYIYLWLKELESKGYISMIVLQPEPFLLSDPIKRTYIKYLKTKTKIVEEHVESSQIYTPDFEVKWTQKAFKHNIVIDFNSDVKKEPHHIFAFGNTSFIEAKPDSSDLSVSDEKNMVRLFRSKQKSVYEKYKVYINLMFHNRTFSESFMPFRYAFSNKTMVSRTVRYKYDTLDEFLDRVNMLKIK